MGMTGYLLRLTPLELDEYKKDSSLLEKRMINYYAPENDDSNFVRLDRAWHGILFLLTGQSFENYTHPLAKIFFSGQLVDENQNLGYGPAHYLTSDQVTELNIEIAKISTDELKHRYDINKMTEMEIYPVAWEDEGMGDYLAYHFGIVRQVFSEAAKNNEAIISIVA